MALNDTLDQMDLLDIFRSFHPKMAECTYFSSARGTFSRIHQILGHKTNLKKFKKTEIILSSFSDHNAMKVEINRKNTEEEDGREVNGSHTNLLPGPIWNYN